MQWHGPDTDEDGWPIMEGPGAGPVTSTAPAVTGLGQSSFYGDDHQQDHDDDDPLRVFHDDGPGAQQQHQPPPSRPAPRSTPRGPGRRSMGRGRKIGVGALGAAVLIGGGALVANLAGGSEPTEPQAQATSLERATPPGWSQDLAWSVPADVQSNIAVSDDRVAFLNGTGILVVVDALTGETVFSSTPTGVNPDSATVALTAAEGSPVAMVIEEGSITSWALGDDAGESRQNSIPSSASVSTSGGGALVITDDQTWTLNEDLGLREITEIPDEDVPMAVTPEGAVVSGSPEGGWSLVVDDEAESVDAEMAEGADGDSMYPAWSSRGVVVAWAPTDDNGTRAVGLYDAESGEVLANTTMPTDQVNLGLPLTVSPDRQLAAVGSWLVDLERGESETVDGWSTSIANQAGVYGSVGNQKMVWTGSGEPQGVDADVAIPWGVSSSGDAVILSEGGSGAMLSGVRPE